MPIFGSDVSPIEPDKIVEDRPCMASARRRAAVAAAFTSGSSLVGGGSGAAGGEGIGGMDGNLGANGPTHIVLSFSF